MKSVGEAMSIGRTFKEALQKGIRSLEIGRFGLGFDGKDVNPEKFQDLDEDPPEAAGSQCGAPLLHQAGP